MGFTAGLKARAIARAMGVQYMYPMIQKQMKLGLAAIVSVLGLVIALAMYSNPVGAQLFSDRILAPPGGIASGSGASILPYNPAAMTLGLGWEIEYFHSEVADSQSVLPGTGDAIYATAHVLGPVHLGVGFEFVRPGRAFLNEHFAQGWSGAAWAMGTFSLGVELGRVLSVGTSLRTFISPSDRSRMNGLVSWDVALHLHSCQYWSLFAAVYDITAPAKGGGQPVERTWGVGAAVRPLGRDMFTITVDNFVGEKTRAEHLRLSIEFEPVRGLGIVAGADMFFGRSYPFPADDWGLREVQVTLALRLDLARVGFWSAFTMASMHTDGWSSSPLVGWSVGMRLSGQKHATVLAPSMWAILALDKGMDSSAVIATIARVERLREDPRVDGVIVEPGSFTATPGVVQDLREALAGLKAKGKKLACWSDETSASAYYLCSSADHVYIGPAGGVRLSGMKVRMLFFTGLLRKLGVNVQMVRIGKYKSWPEQLTLETPSEASLEEHEQMLVEVWQKLVADVAQGREMEPEVLEAVLEQGPFNAKEAFDAGLADGIAFEDELSKVLGEATGHKVWIDRSYWSKPWKPESWVDGRKRVGIIIIDGSIVEGKSRMIPLLNMKMSGSDSLIEAIDAARKDPSIGAVVVRVDSGGGSALASDRIWRAVEQLAEKKPVVASMGGMAASGGYYVLAPATEILANPSTITGSIGIYYGKADLSGLLGKVGVGVTMLEQGGDKTDMESWHRPYTEEEIAYLEKEIGYFYNIFLERVAAGRGKTAEDVDAMGQGRIWTGMRAKELGLVDDLGGLGKAIDRARVLGKVPSWVPVVDLTPETGGLLTKLLKLFSGGKKADSTLELAAMLASASGVSALFPEAWFLLQQKETPLALTPFAFEY